MTRTVLAGGSVFDGTGADPFRSDVAIEGDRVVEVGRGLTGDRIIDVTGRTILPGFIDCHVHVMVHNADVMNWVETPFSLQFYHAAQNLKRTLHAGVTTVRDASGADLGVKRALELELIEGPRMQISINMISQTGGHNDDWYPSGQCAGLGTPHPGMPRGIADGVDNVRAVSRLMLRAGADVLKVATTGGVLSPQDDPRHTQFQPDELAVLVAEANAVGKSVMAHAQGSEGIKNALRAGVRSIEHGIYLDDEAIELMLAHGTWLVPTLVAPVAVIEAASIGVTIGEAMVEKARRVIDTHREAFRRAVDAGVKIAMGTDCGIAPHGTNLRELGLMGQAMKPAAVLAAATSSAAELLGLADQIGTVEAGKAADLVVLSGDPYELDTIGDRIEMVWLAGAEVSR